MKSNKLHHIGWVCCLLLLIGCYENDCGSNSSLTNITGLSGANYRLEGEGYAHPTALHEGVEVAYHQYALKLFPEVTYYAYQEKEGQNSGFFSAAYACSPPEPLPSEEIAAIAVFSNADYIQAKSAKVLVAGDTLNTVFEIYDYYSGRIVGLPDFLVDKGLKASEHGFILKPVSEPASIQAHQFTVHYRLTNGESYIFTAAPVVLTP